MAHGANDKRSGIILRKNTRVMLEDEITVKAGGRDFLKIEDIDRLDVRTKYS